MADPPGWTYPIDGRIRWLLASGLPTRLTPPAQPFDLADYRDFAEQARRYRCEGFLWRAVTNGTIDVDDEARAQAGRDELSAVRARMDYETLIGGVLDLLDNAGIEVRILKGLALARLDYDDDLHRPTGDLDVAVRPEQIRRAVDVLVDAGGYWQDSEPTPGWIEQVGKGATVHLAQRQVEVDLHRILVWGPLGVRLDPADLWRDGRVFEVAGVPRTGLGREETLLHVCAHLLVLGVMRPSEARDVAQILCHPELDADRLVMLARRWGWETILAVAIRHAETELCLGGDAHSLHGWATNYEVSRRDRLWLRAGAARGRVHGVEQLGVLAELGFGRRPGRWAARRTLVRANLRPAPGTYPSAVARLARLAGRTGPQGAGVGRGAPDNLSCG